jgi:desulfoferrodoxin (superoxide reductase-like protein)
MASCSVASPAASSPADRDMWGIAPELTHPATPNAHHLWIEIAMKKAPAYPCLRLKRLNQHQRAE